MPKYTVADFPNLIAEFANTNSIKVTEPVSVGEKLDWICLKGHTFTSILGNRIKGGGCPYCSNKKILAGFNDLATIHPHLAKEWSKDNHLSASEVPPSGAMKAEWVCSLGHKFTSTINDRSSKNSGCPICSNKQILSGYNDLATTHPHLRKFAKSDITKVSAGSKKILDWVCGKGHEYKKEPAKLTKQKEPCPVCANTEIIPGFNDVLTLNPHLNSETDPNFNYSKLSFGSHQRVPWICSLGHTWYTSVKDRTRTDATGCPRCSSQKSKPEEEILEYIESIYQGKVFTRHRSITSPYELDIYLPELGLAFEFNGLHWHAEPKKDSKYHQMKSNHALSLGIRIIHIWEDQWKYRQETVKSLIRHKLGMATDKIYARQTTIQENIPNEEVFVFLDKYHIQGAATGKYRIGLRDKAGDLVAVAVLKKSNSVLRLERYATKISVVGGHSKIVSYIENTIDYSYMETFADLSISDGNLYETTGWTRDKELPPDYMYVVRDRRSHKFNFRKSKFKNNPDLLYEEGLTEYELAKLNNLYRIWDCGKIKYIKEKPNDIKH